MSIFVELKRRNVFKVGIAYAVVAWLVLQVADIVFEAIGTPDWVMQTLLVVLLIGLLLALFFAWAFEMTPEGIKREKDVDRSQSIVGQTGRKLDFAIIGLLVVALGYFIWESRFQDAEVPGPRPAGDQTADLVEAGEAPPGDTAAAAPTATADVTTTGIVVLPFVNMSADPEQEYFSDGLSEEILNALAQIENLRVISRTSAFAFKGKDMAIPEIARQLQVSHVLEGSVRTAGDQVRITAQLIEVTSDSHLWSDAYSRSMENVFEVQEEISLAIAEELQLRLADDAATSTAPTRNAEAYQLFLRGRHEYQKRGVEDLRRAIELLEAAIEIDPEYTDAWANLAAAHIVLGYNLDEGFETHYLAGERTAERAVTIDPKHGFAHAVLGLSAMGDMAWERAVEQLELAESLNPNESNTLVWQGIAFMALGYIDRAVVVLERARALDPVFPVLLNWAAQAHEASGNLDQAERDYQRLKVMNPTFGGSDPAVIALHRGDLDAAEEIMASEEESAFGRTDFTGAMMAALRDPSKTMASADTLQSLRDKASYQGLLFPLFRIGAVDQAVDELLLQIDAGRGLRSANSISAVWTSYDRDKLSHPALLRLFEAAGLANYWRAHGAPDFCRVDGETIECGGQ